MEIYFNNYIGFDNTYLYSDKFQKKKELQNVDLVF